MAVKKVKLPGGKKIYRIMVSARDREGRRHQRKKHFDGSKEEARLVESELRLDLRRQLERDPTTRTWGDIIPLYIEYLTRLTRTEELAASTLDRTRSTLVGDVVSIWKDKPFQNTNEDDIRKLIDERLGFRSGHSRNKLVSYIRGVYKFAISRGYTQVNAAQNIRYRKENRNRPGWTKDQTIKLCVQAKKHGLYWYPHYVIATTTGMRNGELYALRWDQIDFDRNVIDVCRSWDKKAGFKDRTKNGKSRSVPINTALKKFLLTLKEELPADPNDFVLPRSNKWKKGYQARELRSFCRMIDIPPIKFHDLRSVAISRMLLEGVPVAKVMKIVGHKQLETTTGYFEHTAMDLQGANECMNFVAKLVEEESDDQ